MRNTSDGEGSSDATDGSKSYEVEDRHQARRESRSSSVESEETGDSTNVYDSATESVLGSSYVYFRKIRTSDVSRRKYSPSYRTKTFLMFQMTLVIVSSKSYKATSLWRLAYYGAWGTVNPATGRFGGPNTDPTKPWYPGPQTVLVPATRRRREGKRPSCTRPVGDRGDTV